MKTRVSIRCGRTMKRLLLVSLIVLGVLAVPFQFHRLVIPDEEVAGDGGDAHLFEAQALGWSVWWQTVGGPLTHLGVSVPACCEFNDYLSQWLPQATIYWDAYTPLRFRTHGPFRLPDGPVQR